jgi:serine phosphatase RsbU (regulator of sigma subunit)
MSGDHDHMVVPGMAPPRRTAHRVTLTPGTCVLFYTDGLIERPGHERGRDIDIGAAHAVAVLAQDGERPLPELLELSADDVGGTDPDDDIALLAIRVPLIRYQHTRTP